MKCLLWHNACNRFTTVYDHLYNVCVECKHEAQYALCFYIILVTSCTLLNVYVSSRNANRSSQVEERIKYAR